MHFENYYVATQLTRHGKWEKKFYVGNECMKNNGYSDLQRERKKFKFMLQIRTEIFINPLNMKFCVINMQISFKNKLQISVGCSVLIP